MPRAWMWWTGIVLCGGCAAAPPHVSAPEWLGRVPQAKQEVCAVGVSGPTYYAEDAKGNSVAAARAELGRALEVRVKSALTINAREDARGSDTSAQETSGFASDAVLKRAQVRDQWVHPGGDDRYGTAGTVYTMVCMPLAP